MRQLRTSCVGVARQVRVRSVVAGLVLAAVVVSACSSDDTATPPSTTTAPPASGDVSTTTETPASETTTTAADAVTTTTAPPTETSDPSVSIETVLLTTTTTTVVTVPLSAEEQEVVDAVLESFRLYNELRLDPTNDAKYNAALARFTGAALESGRGLIDGYRAENKREVPFPNLPASLAPYRDTIVIADDGSTASVDVCWLNSNTLVETGGAEDGSDRVINDEVASKYERYVLVSVDGDWLVAELAGGDVFPGALTCE